MSHHVLVVRFDNLGDVLLSGPLVRAVAAGATQVSYLCSPRGEAAARLLPGVDQVIVADAGWIEDPPPPVTGLTVRALIEAVQGANIDEAVVLTSFHQSPLPTALVLRMAGVARIGAISVDYPGTLIDVRHRVDDDCHEVLRSLALGRAMGFTLPDGDPGTLAVTRRTVVRSQNGIAPPSGCPSRPYVVIHPGASVSARAAAPEQLADAARLLLDHGLAVVVTGTEDERPLTAQVAVPGATDLGGRGDLADLAEVIAGAQAIVVGNTGPAHLAAAVGTPVVSLYAPTVPASRWRPWAVPHVLLGEQDISCAGCRARQCPVAGHPCLGGIRGRDVLEAVGSLTGRPTGLSAVPVTATLRPPTLTGRRSARMGTS